ncbi:hypothetical protein V8C35DRAFT_300392 [Trichoderma chlorosporum]
MYPFIAGHDDRASKINTGLAILFFILHGLTLMSFETSLSYIYVNAAYCLHLTMSLDTIIARTDWFSFQTIYPLFLEYLGCRRFLTRRITVLKFCDGEHQYESNRHLHKMAARRHIMHTDEAIGNSYRMAAIF